MTCKAGALPPNHKPSSKNIYFFKPDSLGSTGQRVTLSPLIPLVLMVSVCCCPFGIPEAASSCPSPENEWLQLFSLLSTQHRLVLEERVFLLKTALEPVPTVLVGSGFTL